MKDESRSETIPLVILAFFTIFCIVDATTHCGQPAPPNSQDPKAAALIQRTKLEKAAPDFPRNFMPEPSLADQAGY
jgi:hypothetical protein